MEKSVNISLSEKPFEQMTDNEKQEWMRGNPTREDVSIFVSEYINKEVIPTILRVVDSQIYSLTCRNLVLQGFLVSSGICTEEEISESYEKLLRELKIASEKSSTQPTEN